MLGLTFRDIAFVGSNRFTNEVTDWANRVVANGGSAPSAGTKTALSTFVAGCKADAIWAKIFALNCFVPDNLIACFTPLVVGSGSDPWINSGGLFVNGDLSVNGLTGNASNNFLNTGILPSTMPSNLAGWSAYVYTASAT